MKRAQRQAELASPALGRKVNISWRNEPPAAAAGEGDAGQQASVPASQPPQEDPVALNDLAEKYYNGNGVPQDHAQAAQLFRRAAEQGYARAQTNLAELERKIAQQQAQTARSVQAAAPSSGGGICRSVDDFTRRFDQIRAQYPEQYSQWGSRQTFIYTAFVMQRGIEALQGCGSGMSRADYDANMNALVNARDSSIRSCQQISTAGASCALAYPPR